VIDLLVNGRSPVRFGSPAPRERPPSALAGRPKLLLADEPTGQLDQETGQLIMRLLRAVVRSEGRTAMVAPHDPVLIDLADEVLRLHDGKITAG
jgi:putative ABC transport system ATP-binding protein